jgi:sirohydrochlorin ferrochelatase
MGRDRQDRVRHPRLSPAPARAEAGRAGPAAAGPPPLVAVAHGSKDPRAAASVHELLGVVRAQSPGLDVRAAFLDHCAPAVGQVLGALAGAPAVVVPLLLTAAYHSKTDIPAQLAAATAADPGQPVAAAGTLGPDPLLVRALERRLAEAGVPAGDAAARAATRVVLAAAGSSDPAANATVAALAARWARERGWQAVVPAYASAAGPSPDAAVRALRAQGDGPVVVATYLLSPGYFADTIRSAALGAGAAAVAPVLGAAPEVAAVVLGRYAAATAALDAARVAAAGPGAVNDLVSGVGRGHPGR